MKKRLFLTYLTLCTLVLSVPATPKYDIRAAWITSAYGLDWPRTRATDAQSRKKQQKELTDLLDLLKAANFNTVLFQARTRGDVFYNSEIEPYNALLTGTCGQSPGYDPLAFAIEECHKRGMECHAWIVAIPLGNLRHVNSLGKNSVVRKHKNICLKYNNEYFLNPGNPQTKQYLMSLVKEMVTNYDLDGVHFDYLRYPERAKLFPDNPEFRAYANGRSKEQWRRDNLSEIVRYIYKGVKALKPWVKVSSSPVGKYRDTSRFSSFGWNAYNTVYQDVQGWLGEGIQDQIYPMMYFRDQHFYPFVLDWKENCNNRHVVPGLGIYFLDPKEGNWKLEEVKRQINFLRSAGVNGEAFYRTRYLENDTQGLYSMLREEFFLTPALQPPMPWLDDVPPAPPGELKAEPAGYGYLHLTWKESADNDQRNKPHYVVYASDTYPVDTEDPHNIVATQLTETEFYYTTICPWEFKPYFAVTAIDRYGNESEPAQIWVED